MAVTRTWMPGGLAVDLHVRSKDTGGAFCLLTDHPPAGWSLPPHRHRDESETIHVIDGRFEVTVDGRPHELNAGETIHIPAGTLHAGRNVGEAGRRMLVFAPGGMEGFFLEAGVPAPEEEADPRRALELALAYGWQFA